MPEGGEKNILNTLAKGAGITFFGMMFSKFISYLYRLMIARIGPDAYGQFSQALAIVSIFSVICGLSLGNGLEKFIPEFRQEKNKARIKGIVVSALQLTSTASIITGAALFIVAPYIAPIFSDEASKLTLYIRILSVIPLFTRAYEIFMDTLVAYKEIKYKILSTHIFESIVQIGVTFALIMLGWGVTGAIVGYLSSTFLGMILAFYFMEKKIGPILTDKTVKSIPMRRDLLNYSLPLLGVSIMNVAMGHLDTLFLGYFSTDTAVGLYSAAYPTAVLLTLPGTALGSLALTSFSEMRQKEDKSIDQTMKTLARWNFSLTFPGLLVLGLFSGQILKLLFGAEYSAAGPAMTILAAGYAASSSTGKIIDYLKSESDNNYIMKAQIINFILNAGINIILIPIYGITGAAIGTSISSVTFSLILMYRAKKTEDVIAWEPHLLKIIFSGLTSLIITYSILKTVFSTIPPLAVVPAGILYFILYIMIYAATGLKQEDWDMWYKILRKFGLLNYWKKWTRKLRLFEDR